MRSTQQSIAYAHCSAPPAGHDGLLHEHGAASALRAPILALLTLFENHRLALLALSENHRLALLALSENHQTDKSDARFRSKSRASHNEIKHAARVLSRYRDARRTRILRIRLWLTVRVNHKKFQRPLQASGTFFYLASCRIKHAASNASASERESESITVPAISGII